MIRPVSFLAALLLVGCQWLQPSEGDCADGRLNGRETGVDCGGSCRGCAEDGLCLTDGDCESTVCMLNRCSAPSCSDAVRNGDELEVDCGGKCAACTSCGAPLLACDLTCVDPLVDPSNCGACGVGCGGGFSCVAGKCAPSCLGGTRACGGACVDPGSNPIHCGGCNQPCIPGELCVGGMCFFPCAQGQVPCGGACVSLDRDALHCGGCNQPCLPGTACVVGQCTPISSCALPLEVCIADAGPPMCVDPRFDPSNCGGCGVSCDLLPHADGLCVDAGCVLGGCQPGFENCNGLPGDGCEAELSVDPLHCGLCTQACTVTESCALGRCCGPLPPGNYQATCNGCEACNGNLTCMCEDAMQIPRPASVPLGCAGSYTNCNGVLLCDGC